MFISSLCKGMAYAAPEEGEMEEYGLLITLIAMAIGFLLGCSRFGKLSWLLERFPPPWAKRADDRCRKCGSGNTMPAVTKYLGWRGETPLAVPRTPCRICTDCGDVVLSEAVQKRLDHVIRHARAHTL